MSKNLKRGNRCVECRKFRAWDDLTVSVTPDTVFSSEQAEATCSACLTRLRLEKATTLGRQIGLADREKRPSVDLCREFDRYANVPQIEAMKTAFWAAYDAARFPSSDLPS